MPGFFTHLRQVISLWQLPREQRRIVFYSEGRAYWIHLKGVLTELLANSEHPIVYLTSSADDPGLALQHPRLHHCLIDEGAFRNWVFANIDCDLMVMTMPDLEHYQVKRSRHPVHYAYLQHSLVSFHMVYRTGAFDHFDTLFCAGPHHLDECRALEAQRGTTEKQLLEHGYSRLDDVMNHRQPPAEPSNEPAHVLLAPSWGEQATLEVCGLALIGAVLQAGYRLTLRPHPQTFKQRADLIRTIMAEHGTDPRFHLDRDTASQQSLQDSDLMISDWSGAALDYAFGLEKPVVFMDVPRKVNNPDYQQLDLVPLEVSLREQIGAVVSPDDLGRLGAVLAAVLKDSPDERRARLAALRDRHVFNAGQSDQVGARMLDELTRQLLASSATTAADS